MTTPAAMPTTPAPARMSPVRFWPPLSLEGLAASSDPRGGSPGPPAKGAPGVSSTISVVRSVTATSRDVFAAGVRLVVLQFNGRKVSPAH